MSTIDGINIFVFYIFKGLKSRNKVLSWVREKKEKKMVVGRDRKGIEERKGRAERVSKA